MPKKPKDDTPEGGWLGPAVDGRCDPRPSIRYAAGVRHGKWVWKDIDDGYATVVAKLAKANQPKKRRVKQSA